VPRRAVYDTVLRPSILLARESRDNSFHNGHIRPIAVRQVESLLEHEQSSSGLLDEPFAIASMVASSVPGLTAARVENYTVYERIGAGGIGRDALTVLRNVRRGRWLSVS
jgi:hypothetical protein